MAVANEMVIAHPQGHDGRASAALSLLLFGGPVLFLAAWAMPPYVALILVGASLTILAILDQRSTPAPWIQRKGIERNRVGQG